MDGQTIAIVSVGAVLIGAFLTIFIMMMQRIDRLGSRIGETNAQIAQLGARLDARIDELGARLDARIDETNARIDQAMTSLSNHRHDVDGGVLFQVPTPDD